MTGDFALWRLLGDLYILCWIPAGLIVGKLMPKANLPTKILLIVWWGIWAAPLLIVVPVKLLRGDKLWFQR